MAHTETRAAPIAVDEGQPLAPSAVVTAVVERVLAAVHTGELLPGQRISDAALAEQMGVSRTPVREALLRLREIGVVEASASRFTRVAAVTPLQTRQAFTVWTALYLALLDEVAETVPDSVLDLMAADKDDFLAGISSGDPQPQPLATANFLFYQRLVDASENPALQRAIASVVHVVRLGGVHLPKYVDVAQLAAAHDRLLGALRRRDLPAAQEAIRTLAAIEIPLD